MLEIKKSVYDEDIREQNENGAPGYSIPAMAL